MNLKFVVLDAMFHFNVIYLSHFIYQEPMKAYLIISVPQTTFLLVNCCSAWTVIQNSIKEKHLYMEIQSLFVPE